MAVFTLETDYPSDTGYPLDNWRQIDNKQLLDEVEHDIMNYQN